MGETILVRVDLAPELIAADRTLLSSLDARAVDVVAAFWLLDESSGFWHLVLGGDSIREEGSSALYRKVNRILTKQGFRIGFGSAWSRSSINGHRWFRH